MKKSYGDLCYDVFVPVEYKVGCLSASNRIICRIIIASSSCSVSFLNMFPVAHMFFYFLGIFLEFRSEK